MLRPVSVVAPAKKSRPFPLLPILAGSIVSLLNPSARAEEVWNQSVSGSWSNSALWQDGTAPLSGGDPALVLRFAGGLPASFTATNDLGAPFVLDQLVLDSHRFGAITIASASDNSLEFGGTSPVIAKTGAGTATVSSAMMLRGAGGVVSIDGGDFGNLNLSGFIAQTGGAQTLAIQGAALSANVQRVTLSNLNIFTGGVRLDSGNLSLTHASALGTGPLIVNGGTLRLGAFTLANVISLNSDLIVQSPGGATLGGVITGSAGVTLRSSAATLSLSNSNIYTGATTLDYSLAPAQAASGGGTLQLAGNSASALNSSGFNVRSGSTLVISALSTGASNRIGDATPVHLRSGLLAFNGTGGSVAQTESVGALSSAGYSTVTVSAISQSTRLTAASLARVERGTFLFRGTAFGGAFANGVGNVLFTSAPAGLVGSGTGSILPYAIGDTTTTGTGSTFLNYSATTGLRPLAVGEYATSLAAATATSNVRLTAAATQSTAKTINSLIIASVTVDGSPLTLASGALLATGTATVQNPLSFGAAEASIFSLGSLTLAGPVSGANGLTKSGIGTLQLNTTNTFSGPLTVNAGLVSFAIPSAFGNADATIILNANGAGLSYIGSNVHPFSLTRDLATNTGIGLLQATSTGKIAMTGRISGAGGMRFATSTGWISLSSGNTYAGTSVISGGTLIIPDDTALGTGSGMELSGSAMLQLTGPWTTARELSMTNNSGSAKIDTAGFAATINGPLIGAVPLIKAGTGTLTITKHGTYSGAVLLEKGRLVLTGDGSLASTSFTLAAGTLLDLDHTAETRAERVSPTAAITLGGGELRIRGSATAPISQALNGVTFSASAVPGILTLTTPGIDSTNVMAGTLGAAGALGLVRGTNLGGGPGGVFTRAVFSNLTPANAAASVAGLLVDTDAGGSGNSFAVYDFTTDAGGPIGLRPLMPAEYAAGGVIQNPANGGATPVDAAFLANGVTSALGARNEIGTLTMDAGTALTLSAGQTLAVSGGGILARAGGDTSIAGGTLEFLSTMTRIHTGGDLTINSAVSAPATLRKTGTGALTLAGPFQLAPSGLVVVEGSLRPAAADTFSAQTIVLGEGGAFDAGSLSPNVGGFSGSGTVMLRDQRLTLGTSPLAINFAGSFTGTGSLEIVDGGAPYVLRTLTGASTFSGGATLASGRLSPTSSALGTGILTAHGGALHPPAGFVLNNPLAIPGSLSITGSNGMTVSPGVPLTGAGELILRGAGTINVQTAAAFTGTIRTGSAIPGDPAPGLRTFTLSGPGGGFRNAAAIRLENTFFELDDSAGVPAAGERLAVTTPIFLRSSNLVHIGNASTAFSENVGPLTIEGRNTIQITAGAVGTSLSVAEIVRPNHGVLAIRGNGLGGTGATQSRIFLSTPPALVGGGGSGSETSIVPWAYGYDSLLGSNNGLVTYSASLGLRPLTSAEVPVADFAGVLSPTGNYRATTAASTASPVQINALVLSGGEVSGAGTIRLGSGVLLDPMGTTVQNPIDFGTAEGLIMNPIVVVLGPSMILNGPISGTGGITLSSTASAITLGGANTFTGGLRISSGALAFTTLANLGADTTPIQIQSGSLRYKGSSALTLARGMEVSGETFVYGTNAAPLIVSGIISGEGSLSVPTTGTLRLTGTNTFTGSTLVDGTLTIDSDAALGDGGSVSIGNRVVLSGDWTTSRTIETRGTAALDTAGYNAVWNGPLVRSGTSNLAKVGAGIFTLTAASSFDGTLAVGGGVTRLAGAGELLTPSISIDPGAALVLDNTLAANSDRLPDTTALQINAGELQIIGHADTTVRESLGSLSLSSSSRGRFLLSAPGNGSVLASLAGVTLSSGRLIVRGDHLGGADSGKFTRLVLRTAPVVNNGIATSIMADRNDGLGANFAIYDTATDSEGIVGLRPLRLDEFMTDFTLPGGAPRHFHVSGTSALPASVVSAPVTSLTVAPGTRFSMNAGQSLTLSNIGILAQAGAPSLIEGGRLIFGSNRVNLLGDGDITFTSDFSGSGGFTKSGSGTVHLAGPTSWNGTFDVLEGTLRVSPQSAFAGATVNLGSAGTFAVQEPATDLGGLFGSGVVQLGSGRLRTMFSSTSFLGDIRGSGDLQVLGSFILNRPTSYSGLTLVGRDPARLAADTSTLSFSSTGSVLNSRGLEIGTNGTVTIYTTDGINPVTRFGTVPVTLSAGSLLMSGNTAAAATQTFGPLTVTGRATLNVQSTVSATQPLTLAFSDFTRLDRGTLRISLGGAATNSLKLGPGLVSALRGAGTGPTNTPILPFVVETGLNTPTVTTNTRFVTYDATNGIRPLNPATEMTASLVAGQNVNLTTPTTVASEITVNSLRFTERLDGPGRITVSSGAVMALSTFVYAPLHFGASEGIIFVNDFSYFYAPISGNGGLTISGMANVPFGGVRAGGALLQVENPFSGPLTVNSTSLIVQTPGSLGVGTDPIILHDASLEIRSPSFVLDRPLRTTGWQAAIATSSGITITQPISGSGGMHFGEVTLLGPNSYQGATRIGGTVTINQDAVFGASPLLTFQSDTSATPLVRLAADWSTTRTLSGSIYLSTAGFSAQLGGTFLPGSTLVKFGAGELSIADPRGLGAVTIDGGTLVLAQPPGGNGPASVTVNADGTLQGEASITGNLIVNGVLSPGESAGVITAGGALTLNSGARISLEIGGPTPGLYDQVRANTGLSIASNVMLSLLLTDYTPSSQDVFYLLTHADALALTVPFHNMPEGATVSLGGEWTGTLTYLANWTGTQGGSSPSGGNDVALYNVVPEPNTILLLAGSGLILARSRRRKISPST